jgi:hypothetical protein
MDVFRAWVRDISNDDDADVEYYINGFLNDEKRKNQRYVIPLCFGKGLDMENMPELKLMKLTFAANNMAYILCSLSFESKYMDLIASRSKIMTQAIQLAAILSLTKTSSHTVIRKLSKMFLEHSSNDPDILEIVLRFAILLGDTEFFIEIANTNKEFTARFLEKNKELADLAKHNKVLKKYIEGLDVPKITVRIPNVLRTKIILRTSGSPSDKIEDIISQFYA